jgi:hypothetical protein
MKKKSKFKSNLKEIFAWIVISLIGLIIVSTFFFPLILSIITNQWWYLLLFFISWIPTLFEVILIGIIVHFSSYYE